MRALDTDESLNNLPELIKDALEDWLMADLNLEELEAKLYTDIKIDNPKATVEDIKSKIRLNKERHDLAVKVILARTEYKRLDERLMAIKKQISFGGPR
jgi:hypothetical protein